MNTDTAPSLYPYTLYASCVGLKNLTTPPPRDEISHYSVMGPNAETLIRSAAINAAAVLAKLETENEPARFEARLMELVGRIRIEGART